MDFLENEKQVSTHNKLILTSKRLIYNKSTSFGRESKEIPLNKITSIENKYKVDLFYLLLGFILTILPIYFHLNSSFNSSFGFYIKIGMSFVGFFIILINLILSKEYVYIKSSSDKITFKSKDLYNFLQDVRREIYS